MAVEDVNEGLGMHNIRACCPQLSLANWLKLNLEHAQATLSLAQINCRGFAASFICLEFKRHFLSIFQTCEARAFDGTDVHEHIFSTVRRCDKAEAFGWIKPFYGSLGHDEGPFVHQRRRIDALLSHSTMLRFSYVVQCAYWALLPW